MRLYNDFELLMPSSFFRVEGRIGYLSLSNMSNSQKCSKLKTFKEHLGLCFHLSLVEMYISLFYIYDIMQEKGLKLKEVTNPLLQSIFTSFWSRDLLEAIQGIALSSTFFLAFSKILEYFIMFSFRVLTCLKIVSIHIILNLNKFRQVWTCSDMFENPMNCNN